MSESDLRRLRDLVELADLFPWCDRGNLDSLELVLADAQVVSPARLPADRVSMYSTVHVTDLTTGNRTHYVLVFPSDANIAEHKISVLAPIGTALLGSRTGAIVKVDAPGGNRRLHIDAVMHQAGLEQTAA